MTTPVKNRIQLCVVKYCISCTIVLSKFCWHFSHCNACKVNKCWR